MKEHIRPEEAVSNREIHYAWEVGMPNSAQTFIGAAPFHFAGWHIEDTGVLDVGALDEMDPNVDMVGTIRMLLPRAYPLRDRPTLVFADTLDMSEEILESPKKVRKSEEMTSSADSPRVRDNHTLCM